MSLPGDKNGRKRKKSIWKKKKQGVNRRNICFYKAVDMFVENNGKKWKKMEKISYLCTNRVY